MRIFANGDAASVFPEELLDFPCILSIGRGGFLNIGGRLGLVDSSGSCEGGASPGTDSRFRMLTFFAGKLVCFQLFSKSTLSRGVIETSAILTVHNMTGAESAFDEGDCSIVDAISKGLVSATVDSFEVLAWSPDSNGDVSIRGDS